MRVSALASVLFWLAACGTLPEVPDPVQGAGAASDYPDFLPIGDVVLVQRDADARNLETEEQLAARLAGLRARAARLRAAPVE